MNSLLLGIFVALAVWIFIKLRQRTGGFRGLPSSPDPSSSQRPEKRREIPRIGVPGTITHEQITALKRNLFRPSGDWSFEEAALVLDTVSYLRAVCAAALGKKEPPLQVQNELLAYILEDQDLRDYVRKWGKDRREAGIDDKPPQLKRNDHYERVAKMAIESASR
jgi:hypothetical protein